MGSTRGCDGTQLSMEGYWDLSADKPTVKSERNINKLVCEAVPYCLQHCMSHFVSPKSRKVSVSEWAKDAGGQHPPTFELWDKPVLTQSKDEYSCGDIAAMCLEACRARSLHHNKIVSPP